MTNLQVTIATVLLGAIAVLVVIAVTVLALDSTTVPDSLIALGAGAGGALAGVLVPRSTP